MKNLVIGQSGGPTAVINASLYGAVKAFKESGTDGHVLGMINGIEGFLADHVMDLSTDLSDEELELLKLTPAAISFRQTSRVKSIRRSLTISVR